MTKEMKKELLNILKNNCRLSYEELAVMIGSTAPEVEAAMKELGHYGEDLSWSKTAGADAAVVIAGDVDVAQVRAWVQQTYGAIGAGALPARKPRLEPAQAEHQVVDRLLQRLLALQRPGVTV